MIRLSTAPRGALPLLLGGGAALHLRPATFLEWQEAVIETGNAGRAMQDAEALSARYGLPASASTHTLAFAELVFLVEIAVRIVERIEGIELDGAAAPVEPKTFALLFLDPAIATAFRAAAMTAIHAEHDEKKG
jgi:hypothetical protein